MGRASVERAGRATSPRAYFLVKGKRPPASITSAVTASVPFWNSASGMRSPACSRRARAWSPMRTPWATLLRAWMGAKDAAMAIRMPDHFSA